MSYFFSKFVWNSFPKKLDNFANLESKKLDEFADIELIAQDCMNYQHFKKP